MKVQDVVTGEPKLMNLLSKNSSQNLAVESDNQELELDLSSLGAVNTMFAAFFSKLGVPIKTTVSATVLEEALNGLVTIRPLPLGHNISKRAYKAASRLTSTTPPPAHVLSRGIGWQGIGILLNSLFGTLTGSTVSVASSSCFLHGWLAGSSWSLVAAMVLLSSSWLLFLWSS
ncbi:hypothetical protein JHK87_006308 [Glycine soja]|nr:hypothetical protein JHK87_006308 [Glycine soja]